MMTLTGGTEDHRAAVDAFVAKEKPVFQRPLSQLARRSVSRGPRGGTDRAEQLPAAPGRAHPCR